MTDEQALDEREDYEGDESTEQKTTESVPQEISSSSAADNASSNISSDTKPETVPPTTSSSNVTESNNVTDNKPPTLPAKRKREWGTPQKESETNLVLDTATVKGLIEQEPLDRPSASKKARTESQPTPQKPVTDATESKKSRPPRRPVSNTLFIDGFVRPLMVKQVREILQKYGEIVLLWMNSIKSQAYFSTVEAATSCREALYGYEWKPGTSLSIDYSTQVLAQQVATRAAGAPGSITAAEVKELLKNQPKEEDSVKVVEQQEPSKDLTNDKAEPPLTLDSLFKKTKGKPHIYYLPLTDAQVQAKRARRAAVRS